jgi:hypothetical protein
MQVTAPNRISEPRRFDPRPVSFAERDGVFPPHGLGTGQALTSAVRQARVRHAAQAAGVEDLALGILAISEGLVPTDPDGTRRVRDCTERRNPGPLPPGKLTPSHRPDRPAMPRRNTACPSRPGRSSSTGPPQLRLGP